MPQSQTHAGFGKTDALLLLMAIIWGVNFSIVKFATGVMSPLAFTGLRVILAAAVLLALAVWGFFYRLGAAPQDDPVVYERPDQPSWQFEPAVTDDGAYLVITIGDGIPTQACLDANAHALARYSAICQEASIVPIVEPEVLLDGNHAEIRKFRRQAALEKTRKLRPDLLPDQG